MRAVRAQQLLCAFACIPVGCGALLTGRGSALLCSRRTVWVVQGPCIGVPLRAPCAARTCGAPPCVLLLCMAPIPSRCVAPSLLAAPVAGCGCRAAARGLACCSLAVRSCGHGLFGGLTSKIHAAKGLLPQPHAPTHVRTFTPCCVMRAGSPPSKRGPLQTGEQSRGMCVRQLMWGRSLWPCARTHT